MLIDSTRAINCIRIHIFVKPEFSSLFKMASPFDIFWIATERTVQIHKSVEVIRVLRRPAEYLIEIFILITEQSAKYTNSWGVIKIGIKKTIMRVIEPQIAK